MKRFAFPAAVLVAVLAAALSAAADDAAPLGALAKMPVREITVFKDGHALVLHAGKMPTDPAGNVVMDYLPTPIMGTFWPYSAAKEARLTCVVAAQRRVKIDRTATTVRELLEGNIGAEVIVKEAVTGADGKAGWNFLTATILGVPTISSDELAATRPPGADESLPVKGGIILLKTAEGTRVMPLDRIQEVTFKGPHRGRATGEEFRNLLTLRLDWQSRKPAPAADVGMMYVQRGIRWIPNYRIDIDGKGAAAVKLQAMLLNELADLDDVTCNLVIGVPTFAFKDTPDPISLQQTVARLSRYFQDDSQTAGQFSNVMMTQVARMREVRQSAPPPAAADLGPEIGGAEGQEDLFVFTVRHVTLRKGQRMVVPVAEFNLPYSDVYVVDIPFVPPAEVFRNFDNRQQSEIARLLAAPRAMHKIRLTDKSSYPLTTAPALIVQAGRVLAQGMMTYTAVGGANDLEVTAAVDIQVRKEDKEAGRVPNAANWQGNAYARADLQGTVSLTNFRKQAVEIEVIRNVLGNATEADHDGKVEMLNVLEDSTFGPGGWHGRAYPYWWGWYNWPYWWRHFNGVGRITWKVKLDAGKGIDLKYAWNYYWR